jgi:hypothetical protein
MHTNCAQSVLIINIQTVQSVSPYYKHINCAQSVIIINRTLKNSLQFKHWKMINTVKTEIHNKATRQTWSCSHVYTTQECCDILCMQEDLRTDDSRKVEPGIMIWLWEEGACIHANWLKSWKTGIICAFHKNWNLSTDCSYIKE